LLNNIFVTPLKNYLPLNSVSFTSLYAAEVYEGQIYLYNIFTAFVVYFGIFRYLIILVISEV
tara:strand:+ start:514 stop:699 length:186 start_codon:yes stop_codon:yes gene_type:complete